MKQHQHPLAPAGPIDHQGPALYEDLCQGLTHLHFNPEPQMSKNWYSCLYSIALALMQPWDERRHNIIHPNSVESPYEKIYRDMTSFLAGFLRERARTILSRDPQVMFHLYLYEWESYNKIAGNVESVLRHMNEAWAERNIRAGIRRFPLVYTFYCLQWHDHVWTVVRDRVAKSAWQVAKKADGPLKFDNIVKGFPSMKVDGKWAEANQGANVLEILEAPFTSPIKFHYAIVDHYIDEMNAARIAAR
ncbi:hypothetical protein NXS19_010751 [Fusarium pseudograminearum]|nr:hypothetical protein NXS19_010751 [Fusarium pseudograminearum]